MSKVSKRVNTSSKPKNALENVAEVPTYLIKISCIVTGILCVLATIMFDKTQGFGGMTFAVMGLLIVVGFGVFLGINKKLTTQNVVLLLFAAGFILRLNYILYTPLTATSRIRQHDMYQFGGEKGHSAYILHFYNNGFTLPDFNPTTKAQFYHPPLHHFLAGLWMRLLTTFGMSYDRAISSLQFLTLFYSMCCLFVSDRIFEKLNLRGLGRIIAVSIVAFHPTFFILAGSVNNDILSVLFILLSIYTTIRWYKEPTMRNILLIALSIGLGMSTKLSVALVAPPIALVFLIKWISDKKNQFENFGQFCVFGCLCLPLGLWFSVRNFIKYDVPFNYVAKLSDTSDQYIGFRSVYERLFDLSTNHFENVFLNRIGVGGEYFEYNPFVSVIKSSMFGEYNFTNSNEDITPFCKVLLILNIIVIAVSLFAMIYCIIKKSSTIDKTMKIYILSYYLLIFGNYILFSFQYPHTCSMDYRYIVPTLVIGALFIGMFVEKIKENTKSKAPKIIGYSVLSLTSLFCLFSTIVFIMLGV